MKKFIAELIGTFALVLFGCGSAVFGQLFVGADSLTTMGNPITITAIGMCFGLAVLIMAYTIGPISGCNFTPAFGLGFFWNGGLNLNGLFPYWVAQILGGFLGYIAMVLFLLP